MQGNLIYEKLDVGDMTSVREFAKIVQEKYKKIDLLINNGNYFLFSITYIKRCVMKSL